MGAIMTGRHSCHHWRLICRVLTQMA